MATFLRCSTLSDFASQLSELFRSGRGSAEERLRQAAELKSSAPALSTPLWQHRPGAGLRQIPAVRSWPKENRGKGYLTLAHLVSRCPLSGQQNLGLYRVQILDNQRAAINFHPDSGAAAHLASAKKEGRSLPVCLFLGGDPALTWLAAAPLPNGCQEYPLFSALFNEPLDLSPGLNNDLLVPVDAEFVIEGVIDPAEAVSEGPFGNHSGTYVSRDACPLMQLRSLSWREEAIMPFTVVGPPPSENIFLGRASEILIRKLLQIDFPQIQEIRMPQSTLFHGVTLLRLLKASKEDVEDLIKSLWRSGPLCRSKLLLVYDADIDLKDDQRLYWRLINRLHQERIYQDQGRLAIDASGVDPELLIIED